MESSRSQNEYISITAENFEKIHNSTQGIISQVTSITQEVTARSEDTLEACSLNLESVEEVTAIMENLKTEVEKLLQEGN